MSLHSWGGSQWEGGVPTDTVWNYLCFFTWWCFTDSKPWDSSPWNSPPFDFFIFANHLTSKSKRWILIGMYLYIYIFKNIVYYILFFYRPYNDSPGSSRKWRNTQLPSLPRISLTRFSRVMKAQVGSAMFCQWLEKPDRCEKHRKTSCPIPSLPKSSKYLLRRCLEPLKAFSGGVWGFKHLLIRYLED